MYLDIGAAKIQTWIGRSSTLRGRRGASVLLADTTRKAAITEWLEISSLDGVKWNDQAGDVDGIVSLVLEEGSNPESIAGAVLAHLRAQLPRLELQAAWATGDSYAEAYEQIEGMLAARRGISDGAPIRTIPLARSCEDCGLDGVTDSAYHIAGDDAIAVCVDCRARYDAAGRTTATDKCVIPGPEADLARWIWEKSVDHPLVDLALDQSSGDEDVIRRIFLLIPDDAAELASSARGRDGRDGTHLALIYADGNRIGELIERTIAHSSKDDIAREITSGNQCAVVEATRAVLESDPTLNCLPIAPHLIAGDDLLVSLPAQLAWVFTRTYLDAFTRNLENIAGNSGASPSVSAAIIFSHAKSPFADAVELADGALKAAKNHVRGTESSIAWLDTTADRGASPHILPGRTVDDHAKKLSALADLPSSSWATLVNYSRLPHKRTIEENIRRLGISDAVPFLPPTELPLETALDIVRWWR